MEFLNGPSLARAHQEIRLAEKQTSAQKWNAAIDHYRRAIDDLRTVEKLSNNGNVFRIIRLQIDQCNEEIHLCQLRERSEKAIKARMATRSAKVTRTRSTSSVKDITKTGRLLTRTQTLEDSIFIGESLNDDSFSETNAKRNRMKETKRGTNLILNAKKNQKDDSHRIEELQMSNEALKNHLQVALENIEKLKNENQNLRRRDGLPIDMKESTDSSEIYSSHDDDDESEENELTMTV